MKGTFGLSQYKWKWSFTKLDCWLSCQLKFKHIYLDKRAGEIKSDPMAIGSGIHYFIERYSLDNDLSLESLENIYLKEARSQSSLVDPDAPLEYKFLVKKYMESGKVLTPKTHFSKKLTEEFFTIDCGNGVMCNGKTDITTEKDWVVDYKTSNKLYTRDDLTVYDSGKGMQLTIYAANYLQKFGELPKGVGFQLIMKKDGAVVNLGTNRTVKQIEEVKDKIVRIDGQMKGTKTFLKARTQYACRWCDFKHECGR